MNSEEYGDLETFLAFLQDKVEDCYKSETLQAIRRFLLRTKPKGIKTRYWEDDCNNSI